MVTCDYIDGVKAKKIIKYPELKPSASALREAVAVPGVGLTIPVRAAKAKLSALLELVAGGQEVTITSDGKPKATLSRYRPRITGTPYKPNWDLLRSMPMTSDSTEAIRRMRDEGH